MKPIHQSIHNSLTHAALLCLAILASWLLTACTQPAASEPPEVSDPKISAPTPQAPGQEVGISVDVSSASGASLTYEWRVDGGEIIRGQDSPAITYRTPEEPGIYNVRVAVMWDDSSVEKITTIRVEAPAGDTPTPEPPADTPTPDAMQAPPTATVPPPTSTLEPTATLVPVAAVPTNTPEPPPSAPESTFERARRTGVIRVGFAQEHPYGFANSDGSLSGESIEIARLIFGHLGIPKLEGVVTTFESLIPELQANRFDVITAGMWIHPERCEQVLFADPQYKSIVEDRPSPMYGAIAFRKEDADLRDAFNVELQKLKASGELEAILNQFDGYVGATSLPGTVTAAEICDPTVAITTETTTASPQITSERGNLILERGTIAIGIRQGDNYPVTFEENGEYRGFEIDLAREIVQRLLGDAVAVEWVPVASGERLEAVRANRIDFLIRNTTHTRFRENLVAFTSNYFWDGIRLLVRRGGGYTGIESMDGKTIVVPDFTTTSGDSGEAVVRQAAAAAGVNVTILVDDDAYTVFNEGRADGVAMDWAAHSFFTSDYGAHQAVGPLLSSEPIAIAVSLNDPVFRDEVDVVLREIIADGTWRTIYDRWFPEPPPWTIEEMLAASPTAGG